MAKVIVIGGGVAGLSAAHELVDRGYVVEVLERNPRYLGGKARSVDAPGTNGIDPKRWSTIAVAARRRAEQAGTKVVARAGGPR